MANIDFKRVFEEANGDAGTLPQRIKDFLVEQILSGEIQTGTKLPTIRVLAKSIGVNPMTVAKAYKVLAESGYAEPRGSGGTFARNPGKKSKDANSPDVPFPPNIGPAALSRQLFSLARAPGVIGFTTNYPDPAVADVATFRECLVEAASDTSLRWFRYDPATGRDELRYELVRFVARRGITVKMEDIIVTAGAQQALDLVARAIVSPGDAVVIERPTYFGGLNVLRAARARLMEVPLEADGPNVSMLEDMVKQHKPRLIYLNPTFQNPSGVTTSLVKRQRILEIARRGGVAILEDDHCPELRFSGEPVPSLKSLADPLEQVYYATGFGKSFIPGIRLGFLLAPPAGIDAVTAVKATTDLQSTAFMQGALSLFLKRGTYIAHTKSLTDTYRARQTILLDALRRHIPNAMPDVIPEGGLSLWLKLPPRADLSKMYFLSAQNGVAFASGDSFVAHADGAHHVRLSFGLTSDADIPEGIRRLAAVVDDLA